MTPPAHHDAQVTEAVFRYKIHFETSARAAGGTVRWAGQHSLVWGAQTRELDGLEMGVCAGLAMEWLKAGRSGRDLVGDLLQARNGAFQKDNAVAKLQTASFVQEIVQAHLQQRGYLRYLEGAFRAEDQRSFTYPYTEVSGFLERSRSYYISSGSHAMGARVGADGKMDFYDPNVGEITGSSPRFFDTYLKNVVDASGTVLGRSDLPATKKMKVDKLVAA